MADPVELKDSYTGASSNSSYFSLTPLSFTPFSPHCSLFDDKVVDLVSVMVPMSKVSMVPVLTSVMVPMSKVSMVFAMASVMVSMSKVFMVSALQELMISLLLITAET